MNTSSSTDKLYLFNMRNPSTCMTKIIKKNVTLNESNTPFMPCTKHTKSILFKVV